MTSPTLDNNYIYLKPYTVKELAHLYGVERRTLNKWLEPFNDEIGERSGRFYTVLQVKTIFSRLGLPGVFVED